MSTEKKVFHPYKGQSGSLAAGGDEKFSIDLVEENLDKGYRTVRTPEGAVAFIWLLETDGEFFWQIYFPDGDELIKISYTSLESYWRQCDEGIRAYRQSLDPSAAYQRPHPVWAW